MKEGEIFFSAIIETSLFGTILMKIERLINKINIFKNQRFLHQNRKNTENKNNKPNNIFNLGITLILL